MTRARAIRRGLLLLLAAVLIVLGTIGAGLLPINLFFLKNQLTTWVKDSTGLDLHLAGPLTLRLGPRPTLSGRMLRLSDQDSSLVEMGVLRIQPRLGELLDGRLEFRKLSIEQALINYCPNRSPKHSAASTASAEPTDDPLVQSLSLEQLDIQALSLTCSKPSEKIEWLEDEFDLEGSAVRGEPIRFSVQGKQRPDSLALEAQTASLLDWLSEAWHIENELSLVAGQSNASIRAILNGTPGQLLLEVTHGKIRHRAIDLDLTGSLQQGPERPRVNLVVHQDGWSPDGSADRSSGSAATTAPAETDSTFTLEGLLDLFTQLDGRLDLSLNELRGLSIPIRDVRAAVTLEKGTARVEEASLKSGQTPLRLKGHIHPQEECTELAAQLSSGPLQASQLHPMFDDVELPPVAITGGRAEVNSCGTTWSEWVDQSTWQLELNQFQWALPDELEPLGIDTVTLGLEMPEPGIIALAGQLNDPAFSAELEARWNPSAEHIEAAFKSLAPDSDLLHPWLGFAKGNHLPFSAGMKLVAGDQALQLSDVALTLGKSSLRGSITIPDSVDQPIDIDVSLPVLDLAELDRLLEPQESVTDGDASEPGSFEAEERTWSEDWLDFPSSRLKLSAGQIHGLPFQLETIQLDTAINDRKIADAAVSLVIEGIKARGNFSADLRDPEHPTELNLDLGGFNLGELLQKFDIAQDVTATAGDIQLIASSHGRGLMEQADNIRLEAELSDFDWATQAGPGETPFHFRLAMMSLDMTPAEDTQWTAEGAINGTGIRLWMQSPSLAKTFDRTITRPIRLLIESQGELLGVEAAAHPRDPASGVRRLDLGISSQKNRGQGEGKSPDLSSVLAESASYSIKTTIHSGPDAWRLDPLDLKVGSSTVSSAISVQPSPSGYRIDAQASSPFLETDDFVQWLAEFREFRAALGTTNWQEEEDTAGEIAEELDVGLLLNLTTQMSELADTHELNLVVTVDELRSSGELLGDAEAHVSFNGKEFSIAPVTVRLPGGNVDGRYTGRFTPAGFESDMNIHIEQLEYGGLIRLFDPDAGASGDIHLDIDLVSVAPGPDQSVEHLNGTVDILAFPEDVQAGFLDLWASNLIFALLPGEDSEKKMNCLVGRFEVENGVMRSRNTFLDSTDIIVRARGEIDLVQRELDLLVAPQAKRERFFSVSAPIEVAGSFDDFSVGVAAGGFLTTMVRWYYSLIYVPWKWLTGERFPEDGEATCLSAMDMEQRPTHGSGADQQVGEN